MKKGLKVLGIILGIIIVIGLIFFVVNFDKIKNSATMSGVVVKVNKNSLCVMRTDGTSLYSVSLADEGNIGFKLGQEILIYWDGIIAESYPAQIHNVWEIKIVKETSDTKIPDNVLRYYYSSRDNVTFAVSELTKTGISFSIKDTNELPYSYSFKEYKIFKKNKEAENVSIDYSKLTPATENSTSAYVPDKVVPVWEEAPRISNSASENMVLSYESEDTLKVTCDWTNVYGTLEERRI